TSGLRARSASRSFTSRALCGGSLTSGASRMPTTSRWSLLRLTCSRRSAAMPPLPMSAILTILTPLLDAVTGLRYWAVTGSSPLFDQGTDGLEGGRTRHLHPFEQGHLAVDDFSGARFQPAQRQGHALRRAGGYGIRRQEGEQAAFAEI